MKSISVLIALGIISFNAIAAPNDLPRLSALVANQRYADAYTLGETMQREFSGQPDFDLLYGTAALEVGNTGRAVFALERVLMKQPENDRARLLLAHAYIKEGERRHGTLELRALLAHNPPADIAEQARALMPAQPLRTRGFVEVGLGYDSNVNNAVDTDVLTTGNTTILVDPSARAIGDGFARLAFGIDANKPWGLSQFAFVGLNGYENKDFKESNFDTSLYKIYGGGGFDWPRNRFSIPLAHQRVLVDRKDYLRLNTIGMEWRHQLNDSNLVNIAAQYGGYEYEMVNARRANGYAASLGWNGVYNAAVRPRFGGSLFLGAENVDEAALKYFGRRYYGITADGSFSPFKDHSPYVSLKLQRSDYEDADPIYFINRTENYSRLAAGWNWQVQPHWHVRAQADYTTNKSNLSLYEYDAGRLFFSTRFDFR